MTFQERLIDCFGFYAVSAIFQPCKASRMDTVLKKQLESIYFFSEFYCFHSHNDCTHLAPFDSIKMFNPQLFQCLGRRYRTGILPTPRKTQNNQSIQFFVSEDQYRANSVGTNMKSSIDDNN